MITDRQRVARRAAIGGSDAAAILGLDPHKSAYEVWLSKVAPDDSTAGEAAEWGTRLESLVVREVFSRVRRPESRLVVPYRRTAPLRHPAHPVMLGNIDGVAADVPVVLRDGAIVPEPVGPSFTAAVPAALRDNMLFGGPLHVELIEAKCLDARKAWLLREQDDAGPGADAPLPHHLIQCQHYMHVGTRDRTVVDRTHIGYLVGGNDFRLFTIERDPEFGARLATLEAQWWQRHIVDRVEPSGGDPEEVRRYLHGRHPRELDGELLDATGNAEVYALARRVLSARADEKAAVQRKIEIENELKRLIGDAPGILLGEGERAVWKAQNAAPKIDLEAVVREGGESVAQLVRRFTTPTTARHLRIRLKDVGVGE